MNDAMSNRKEKNSLEIDFRDIVLLEYLLI